MLNSWQTPSYKSTVLPSTGLMPTVLIETNTPLWIPLYMYIRTIRGTYVDPVHVLSILLNDFEPIQLPVIPDDTPPLHFITITNLQRWLARRLNTTEEVVHYCLKQEVYPRLENQYEF